MPTENEIKFILEFKDTEERYQKLAESKTWILQGYLFSNKGTSLRLRKMKNKYYLTLKSNVNGRVVEIENQIDERDFNDLWPQCMNKLEKVRYVVRDKQNQSWEIDFFKDHNGVNYFALAELEMPEGQLAPALVPRFIKENLLFEVPLTDCRFASKLLADVRYANDLYKIIKDSSHETLQVG
jgi:CYTH domain-containing protein